MAAQLLGGVEAGGTKFVCAVGRDPEDVRAEARFATTTPAETIGRVVAFFHEQAPIAALGVATFGPVDLDPRSPTFGSITTTPKPAWQHVDLIGPLRRALGVPVRIDTDVNAAALAEHRWGAARDAATVVYVTVGTGIGGGILVNGHPIHGLLHPELGHMRIPRDIHEDAFAGACPHHGDCWEGLASGPALAARWQQAAERLPDVHPAWPLEARYLALGLVNVILTVSPQRIVLGGGVMARTQLFPLIRAEIVRLLGGYLQSPSLAKGIDDYVVPPALGPRAGVLGALALAAAT
jgi:fructokinase